MLFTFRPAAPNAGGLPMPFIHIKSLPFETPMDIPRIIQGISTDVSRKTGVELYHVHTTWEFLLPGHYAKGDAAPAYQPQGRHPLIVDLLTPDFNDTAVVATMLETIADSISTRAGFPKGNIFINHRQARSSMVFDDGEIGHW
jgi:hypothetical protein